MFIIFDSYKHMIPREIESYQAWKTVAPFAECDLCHNEISLPLQANCGHSFCINCLRKMTTSKKNILCRCEERNLLQQAHIIQPNNKYSLFVPPKNPFNQIYVQGKLLGIASYWFDEKLDQSYIYYDSKQIPWSLDDGTKPPERKYFENVSYDSETQVFNGTINWPIPFYQSTKWIYRIRFSLDFTYLESGSVYSYNGSLLEDTKHYEQQLFYRIFQIPIVINRAEGVNLMLGICSIYIARIFKISKSCFRWFPSELLKTLSSFLY